MKCVRGEVSFGDKWVYERLTTKKMCMKERMSGRGEAARRGEPLSVRYSIIWPCGFYRVVTWRTSPQTVFISFTSPFPEPPCFAPTFSPALPPLSSSARAVIRGGKPPTVSPPLTLKTWLVDSFKRKSSGVSLWSQNGSNISIKRLTVASQTWTCRCLWRCWERVSFKWRHTDMWSTFLLVSQIKRKLKNDYRTEINPARDSQSVLGSFFFYEIWGGHQHCLMKKWEKTFKTLLHWSFFPSNLTTSFLPLSLDPRSLVLFEVFHFPAENTSRHFPAVGERRRGRWNAAVPARSERAHPNVGKHHSDLDREDEALAPSRAGRAASKPMSGGAGWLVWFWITRLKGLFKKTKNRFGACKMSRANQCIKA